MTLVWDLGREGLLFWGSFSKQVQSEDGWFCTSEIGVVFRCVKWMLYLIFLYICKMNASITDISHKTRNGGCCLLLANVHWWIHEQPGTWRVETLEGVSVFPYLTCIIHLSLQATISIIYRPPVVSSCLSAFSVTFKHFVNEFYKELAPEGRCNKKQALWVGSGAMCVQHHKLVKNECLFWKGEGRNTNCNLSFLLNKC